MAAKLSNSELLARLVAFDSISAHSNLPIADFICGYLDDPRIKVIRLPSADGQKVNVVAHIDSRPTAAGGSDKHNAGLTLSGHLDVVPAAESDWHSPPFTLTETDETYVGRGACDMKGFVALAMNVARDAVEWNLHRPLALVFSYDEEVGSLGITRIAETWGDRFALPTSTIVGEPTSLRVVRMHKGHLNMRITLTGKGAHSGYPYLGQNTIEPAAKIITALSGLRTELQAEPTELAAFFPETPYVALNVAQITGGEAINIVPDRCVVDLGVRVLPGMDSAPIIQRITQVIESVEHDVQCGIDVLHDNPPMLLPEESKTHRILCDVLDQSETIAASYATDAGMLQQMGLECAVWGPGNIEVAHKPNESMPKSDFVQARSLLEKILRRFCTDE